MFRKKIDSNWTFYPNIENPLYGEDHQEIKVDLPHDYSIIQKRDSNALTGAANGFYPGGMGCYNKRLFIPEEFDGKQINLQFEGVYMNATVYVNDQQVKRHYYGYTSFTCDITPYLVFGTENHIKVNVNNSAVPNCRWYTGSGIYRHVWLEVRDKVHISPNGVFVKTPDVSTEQANICIETSLENNGTSNELVKLNSVLTDEKGVKVAEDELEVKIDIDSKEEFSQELNLISPKLWSVDNPYLYTLESQIIKNGEVIDKVQTKVGIRSISFDPEEGFKLNAKSMKLKGGCVHHDCGILGAAAYDRAEERKVEIHKANGYNAIRCVHNPPSPAFLDACDRIGMLVIDEAFDSWRENKVPNDYGVYFDLCWKNDLKSMILRDRNHPSIIMWSTGNEIIEQDGRSEGNKLSKELADFVRTLDNTRAVTNALYPIPNINNKVDEESLKKEGDSWGKQTEKFAEPLDVVGYNYLRHRYLYDGRKYPERIICGTETYPSEAFDYWQEVEKRPHVIGDFVWTSMDYLGEAGIGYVCYGDEKDKIRKYPWRTAYCGDIDICGFKRPQSYYRDCVWGTAEKPYIAVHPPEHYGETPEMTPWSWVDVQPSWEWPGYEGKPIKIDVYCTESEVELFLNGKSLGRKPAGKKEKYITSFDTRYQAGELVAVAYENGKEKSRKTIKTAGKPYGLRLRPDRKKLKAVSGDLSYITVEVVDKEGNLVHIAENNIYFTVHGEGKVIAIGNSDPMSEETFVGNYHKAYNGRAIAVLRSNGNPGKIVLTAAADGFEPAEVMINVGD